MNNAEVQALVRDAAATYSTVVQTNSSEDSTHLAWMILNLTRLTAEVAQRLPQGPFQP